MLSRRATTGLLLVAPFLMTVLALTAAYRFAGGTFTAQVGEGSGAPTGPGDVCTPICGDSLTIGNEQCDDGNIFDGDGCSALCRRETTENTSSAAIEQIIDGSSSSYAIIDIECPQDGCKVLDGDRVCAIQGKTCEPLSSYPCIQCAGPSTYQCQGDECGRGGKDFCIASGNGACENNKGSDICIDCLRQCPKNICAQGGDGYCAKQGKSCTPVPDDDCFDCVPEPALVCTGTEFECENGGKDFCDISNEKCVPKFNTPCITCEPKLKCTGDACSRGGEAFCKATGGGTCSDVSDGVCVQCAGSALPGAQGQQGQRPYQCQGTECRDGGAKYCNLFKDSKGQAKGCRLTGTLPCIDCTDQGCKSNRECDEGSQCINGACKVTCGNGRVDKGETCDPSTSLGTGGGSGCTEKCVLAENQECQYDTDCETGLCIKNICVPCTTGTQCQSKDCREGSCEILCGNGKVDSGEICDPGIGGDSEDCTKDCRRPVGNACEKNLECQTGRCGDGKTCDACKRNNECLSGLCVSGACVDVCGNGTKEFGEQCDDGNRVTDDGCDPFCQREASVAGELLPISLLGDVTRGDQIGGQTEGDRGGPAGPGQDVRGIAAAHPAAGQTGPAAVVVIASGAAAGWAWMRRKRKPR